MTGFTKFSNPTCNMSKFTQYLYLFPRPLDFNLPLAAILFIFFVFTKLIILHFLLKFKSNIILATKVNQIVGSLTVMHTLYALGTGHPELKSIIGLEHLGLLTGFLLEIYRIFLKK